MSSKVTISHRERTATQAGFHLYDDALDDFASEQIGEEPPVYLRLTGVDVQVDTASAGGVSVTLTLPRDLARALGLLADGTAG